MRHRQRNQRGTTIIEAMIAMGVLLTGLLGFASLQVVTVRANHFNKRMAQASAMATELADRVRLWNYTDTRLNPSLTVSSANATEVSGKWDMGNQDTASFVAQFAEKVSDTNGSTADALKEPERGLTGDVDGDGEFEFNRYWNVYGVDTDGDGTPNGKLVQIIVRWKEPGFGFRQVTGMAFKPNPQSMLQ